MTTPVPLIRDFMTLDPYGIDAELSLADAADRMQTHGIHHLLVMKDHVLEGVVRSSDLELALMVSKDGAADTPVSRAMRPAMMASPFAHLSAVAGDMEARQLEMVVVVDDDALVVGVFTMTDALRAVRALATQRPAEPMVQPDRGDVPATREKTLPSVRVRKMLRRGHAGPGSANGLVMGQVFNQN